MSGKEDCVPDLYNVRPVDKEVLNNENLLDLLMENLSLKGDENESESIDYHELPGSGKEDFSSTEMKFPPRPVVVRDDILGDDAFVLRNLLTKEECSKLVSHTETLSYSFWNNANTEKTDYRNAYTVEIEDPSLAAMLWDRVQHLVLPSITISPDQSRWERGFEGTWKAIGVNSHLLFARYTNGGHFSPHTDGYTVVDFNHRSLYTFLIYLNTCSKGGSTRMFKQCDTREYVKDEEGRFRWDQGKFIGEALANVGEALLFYQDIPHEGAPVEEDGVKYIIRTDIMYERTPMLCNDDRGKKAYESFRGAEYLESNGQSMDALKLYMRAAKLCPEFGDIMGL
eukprot:m.23665 g.23665  ORF g.23665 m.23665 type:complete len:340 (-) comp5570_c0_seq1:102-1121(-)